MLLIFLSLVTYRFRKQLRAWKQEENLRFALAFLLLMAEMSFFWRLLYVGSSTAEKDTMLTYLPLQVCQWTCIASVFMLMKKSPVLFVFAFHLLYLPFRRPRTKAL